jgi:hypothetical protein
MITCKILTGEGITVVEPKGPLSEEDFAKLSAEVDAYLKDHDSLKGLLILAKQFPGWEDFEGLLHHIKFVRDHHRSIRRVALVSDTKLASIAPQLASHFVSAQVKGFDGDARDEALAWLRSD